MEAWKLTDSERNKLDSKYFNCHNNIIILKMLLLNFTIDGML